jgi:hypothetical protein
MCDQAANTRSREQIDENDRKIRVFQDRFNTARKALIALGVEESEIEWKAIADVDLRWMEDPEKDTKRAEWAKKREERAKKNKENPLEVYLVRATENYHGYEKGRGGIQMPNRDA